MQPEVNLAFKQYLGNLLGNHEEDSNTKKILLNILKDLDKLNEPDSARRQ